MRRLSILHMHDMNRTPRKTLFCLIAVFAAAACTLGGCEADDDVKKPTDKTFASRMAERRILDVSRLTLPGEGNVAQRSVDVRVGFIYVGTAGDYGFNYAQNRGRLALMEKLGVQTLAIENVPEDERCMEAMQSLIDNGCTVIFSCSFGFMDYTVKMAEMYPDLHFFHCSGYETRPNMSAYFGRMYQARYLTGIVAGLRTRTNKIGYIAAFPIPEVFRGANAFALGVKSVNPDARVYVTWSHTWVSHGLERKLALEMLDAGCDVLAQHQDTVSPQIAAQERGAWSIGYSSPMGAFAKNAYLAGAVWNWAPYMIAQVERIADGTWKSSNYWGGLEDDVVRLDALTKNVAPGTHEAVERARRRIMNGFDVFEGPIYDAAGRLRVPEGRSMTDAEKLVMDFFVDTVSETAAHDKHIH